MPHTQTLPNNDTTQFTYLEWQDLYHHEKPYQCYVEIPKTAKDQRMSNLVYHEGPKETVNDVRGNQDSFSIEEHGFTYLKHSTQLPVADFTQKELVESIYLPECEALLRETVGDVDQVCFFDWRLRNNNLDKWLGKRINLSDPTQPLGPSKHVHVDQAPDAAIRRVELHCPDQAEFLLRGRVRIINVWRPLNGPVQDWPIAVADASTVKRKNLVETDHVRRQYDGATMYALYDPDMKWYFMSQQNNDEVLLLKNFDSDLDSRAVCSPHAAFPHSSIPENAKERESIEVRALVFTYPKV